jgi:CBS domain-containing protein
MSPNTLVRDAMTRDVRAIGPEDTVADAARLLRDADVGVLPVIENGVLIGMLTDRDVAVRVTAEERVASRTLVREVMTPRVVRCTDEDTIEEAARTMVQSHVRRLPVFDANGLLVGILSVDDIAVLFSEEEERVGPPSP